MPQPKQSWYNMAANATGDEAEIYIYDEIGFWGIRATDFIRDLKALGDVKTINLRINSPGGEVFEGNAIINVLSRFDGQVNVTIDGLAASMASGIAMAGDSVVMADNALMMIHNPLSIMIGDADEMRKEAATLDKVKDTLITNYANKTGMDRDEISALMDAETWMTAEEALEMGFADSVVKGNRKAASAKSFRMLDKFTNLPAELSPAAGSPGGITTNKEQSMSKENQKPGEGEVKTITEAEHKTQITDAVNKAKESTANEAKKAAEAEQARVQAIAKLGTENELTTEALDAIANGKSEQEFKDQIIASLRERAKNQPTREAIGRQEDPGRTGNEPSLSAQIKGETNGKKRIELIRKLKAEQAKARAGV